MSQAKPPADENHDHHVMCRHCGVGINVRCDWDDEYDELPLVRSLRDQVERVEQAFREAEARHAKELAEERYTRCLYLKVWMKRNGGPLRIRQDDLRDAAEGMKAGTRLTFEVEEDGETLRIGEAQ